MKILGVVLAGGLSSRMGQDKASLPWNDNQDLLHRAIEILKVSQQEVWISGREVAGFHCVLDIVPRQGPLGAMHALSHALAATDWDAIAVLPCDMPLVEGDWYGEMADFLQLHPEHEAAVLAHAGKVFPLTGIYRVSGLTTMACSFESGNRKVITALQGLSHGTILKPEHRLMNMNQPEDYQRLLREGKQGGEHGI